MVRPMDRLACHEALIYEVGRREARVIAVVDDDDSLRDALQRFLGTLGFQVETFASGGIFCGRANWAWSSS